MNQVKLGSLAEIGGGWRGATVGGGPIRLIRTTDMSSGEIDWQAAPSCDAPPDAKRLLRHGDVLVARTGAGSVGKAALVLDPPPAVPNENLLCIRPGSNIDSAYLLWYLRTTEGRAQLESRAVGSVMPNISAKRLSTVAIPDHDLPQQLSIASAVESAARPKNAALFSLTEALSSVRTARRSVWAIVVGDNLRSDWPLESIETVTIVRDTGRVPLNAAQRVTRIGDTPYYGASGTIDHVEGFTHDGTFLLISEDGQNLESRSTDVAMVSRGKVWANNHIHVLELRASVQPEFAAAFLNSIDLRDHLTGTTQPKLPLNRLRRITIPVPDLDEQYIISTDIATITATLERWLASLEQTSTAVDRAWQAFLNRSYDQGPESPSPASASASASSHTNPKRRKMSQTPFASIQAALAVHPEGLTPEQLYQVVELNGADASERVDSFYEQLRELVAANRATERRDGESILVTKA